MAEEEDLNLPKAAVNKLIKETLPDVSLKKYYCFYLINYILYSKLTSNLSYE